MKKAIIVGSDGQDGKILAEMLTSLDVQTIKISRDRMCFDTDDRSAPADIFDRTFVASVVRDFMPDEIYYLAAYHQSSEQRTELDSLALLNASHDAHVRGLSNFLQAILDHHPTGRLLNASSCHVFGEAAHSPQDELTPMVPSTVYGITKAAGTSLCQYYRRVHSVYASVGILYNHESTLRRPTFISQKIAYAAVRIHRGLQRQLVVRNLSSVVDWGWAADYTDAMIRILRLPTSDDFVVATGEAHSVQEFVEETFNQVGIDWKTHVIEDSIGFTPSGRVSVGNSSKLTRATGWRPTVNFREMISLLLAGASAQIDREQL